MDKWTPILRPSTEYIKIKGIIDGIYKNIDEKFHTRDGFSTYFEAGGLCLFLILYEKAFFNTTPP